MVPKIKITTMIIMTNTIQLKFDGISQVLTSTGLLLGTPHLFVSVHNLF